MSILLALALTLPGLETRNSADCMGLPPDQQLTCMREIRAGRSYDAHYPENPYQALDSQSVKSPVKPTTSATPQPEQSLEARRVAAAERTASAVETIATVQIVALVLSVLGIIVSAVAN